MLKNLSITALFAFVCISALSSTAFACACCAERGEHSTATVGIDSAYLAMLDNINLDTVAELYETPAGFDVIRGLGAIETEYNAGMWTDFSLVDAFTKNAWSLTFKTPGGKSGTLVLPKPQRVTIFRVDQRDDEAPENAMVVLYKEFRFNGSVRSGSGIFRAVSRDRQNTSSFSRAGETIATMLPISPIGGSVSGAQERAMLSLAKWRKSGRSVNRIGTVTMLDTANLKEHYLTRLVVS